MQGEAAPIATCTDLYTMKIYTRTGDKGDTSLLGGSRVAKDDARIEAYGTVDELNSHIGLLRAQSEGHDALLVDIQNALFAIGSRLACASEADARKFKVPAIADDDIQRLEGAMDDMDKVLPSMRNFVLPGGHIAVAQAHVCRTVCRRAERRVVHLAATDAIPETIVRYLNRLSDLLFVLAREQTQRNGVSETPWTPRQ